MTTGIEPALLLDDLAAMLVRWLLLPITRATRSDRVQRQFVVAWGSLIAPGSGGARRVQRGTACRLPRVPAGLLRPIVVSARNGSANGVSDAVAVNGKPSA